MNSQQPAEQNQHNPAENLATARFPVVGIGASAGGLDAFRQLLSHLPTDTGMAFVLIQHLSPHHKSSLTEILTRETMMPAIEVRDRMAVEPNCVYVIPPNTKMTIEQGLLKLTPRVQNLAMVMPIDTFFRSLAADLGSKAIAVVLSGGNSDGSQGLAAVKQAGGITFAQCEDSAEVSTMPNTAVATGYVDFILTPQQIAVELANISHHPYITSPTPEQAVEAIGTGETAMQVIFSLLKAATRVNFTQYRHATLKRRILRRMVLYKLESIDDYVTYLREHSAEVQALYEDLLIHVTSFFRDPLAFTALGSKVFPSIITKKVDVPVRIWVAGCSTGEEAYSLAICLLEYLDNQPIKPPIQIYATDISDRAIETARAGFYKYSAVADVSPERLQRFFVPVDDGYRIGKLVREMCVFARQNICSDPPFSKLDLISCRNVLIYLGTALQKKILPTFHYGLKPTGFLILGSSETTGDSSNLFTAVDKKQKIYARKLAPARLALDLIANQTSEIANFTPSNNPAGNDFNLQKEADLIVLERFAPVGVVIDNDLEILHFRGQTSLYLEPAPGRASHNLLKMAKDGLKLELRTAVHQARQQNLAVRKENLQIVDDKETRQFNLEVIPLKTRSLAERYFLILFQATNPAAIPQSLGGMSIATSEPASLPSDLENARLKQELANTKEYLRSIIEEQEATNQDLRVANEEILSSNEEFQSSNEELETAKEEIQATNEELNTINDELQRRNHEATEVSNDLQNLISSINIPSLIIGSDLCIRSFTPLAQSVLRLIPTDVGRPLWDINHALTVTNLESQIRAVIDTLETKEQEVRDRSGHWYDLRIRPYRTLDNKIDGAMLILIDIHALKCSMEQLEYSRNYAQAIVETVREPLIVLDGNLQVFTANQSFYDTFEVTIADTEQRSIFNLGNGQWNIPELRQLLSEIIPTNSELQDFEVEHNFEQIGTRTMLLNARKMTQSAGGDNILLAVEDITERKQAEKISQRAAKFDAFRITLADVLRPIADPIEIQAAASRVLGEHLDANRVAYFEVLDGNYVVEYYYINGATAISSSYSVDSFGEVMLATFRRGQAVSECDVAADPDLSTAEKSGYAAIEVGAYIGVPLVKGGEFIAGLAVHSIAPRVWTPDDVTLVEEVAERTWAALERARAEAALRESEVKYRTLFESMDEGYLLMEILFDATERPVDFCYLEANPAAVRMLGGNPTGQQAREFNPQMEAYWLEMLGRVAQTGIGERHELEAPSLGTWYNFYVFRIGNPDSRQVASIFEDITVRKRREANLAFLAEIQEEFTRIVSADEIMQVVGEKIGAYLNTSQCVFGEVDRDRDWVTIEYDWHNPGLPALLGVHQLSDFVSEELLQAAQAGKTIIINNSQTDARTDADRYAALNIHASVIVPFYRGNEWKYVLAINDSRARDWREDEIELIFELTNRIFPRLDYRSKFTAN